MYTCLNEKKNWMTGIGETHDTWWGKLRVTIIKPELFQLLNHLPVSNKLPFI
jgi:hypothetical protein